MFQRLEQARREEKNKFYPEFEQVNERLKAFEKGEQERADAQLEIERQEAERQRLAQEEEMSARELIAQRDRQQAEKDQEIAEQLRAMREDRDRERVLREKEIEFSRLNDFKHRRIMEEQDNIAPQFIDFVRGSTEQEIDASIEMVKGKTQEILQVVQQQQLQQQRQTAPPIGGQPPIDPQTTESSREISVEELRNMSMADYEANRTAYLGAASQRVQQQGLYAP
jgi:hypothetical protein